MAKARMGGAVQSKIAMLLWGAQGTGKSTLALQSAYLKRPDGKPFRVLYIDPESGSVDDYMDELIENDVNPNNVYVVYSQSLNEIREYIHKATNGEPFPMLDDDGNETDEVVLDADGEIFNPDMIIIDGTAVLYMTSQQGLINFSRKRANVRAKKKEMIGDERTVAIENAGLEQKDWGTLKFMGQDLVLDLTACGKHYILTAREKAETETKLNKDGNPVSVATGKKIPESFNGIGYNVKTEIQLYREQNDEETVYARIVKDRTKVHKNGEVIEDPTLLDWQKIIDRTANNQQYVIKNNLDQAAKIEERLYSKKFEEPAESVPADDGETLESVIAKITDMKNNLPPVKKQALKTALQQAGLPTMFKTIKDIETAKAIAAEIEKISA